MIQVTKERFYEFLKGKDYDIVAGTHFHSDFYVCVNNGDRIAYKETSSWGAPDVYKIASDIHEDNLEVVGFISKSFLK